MVDDQERIAWLERQMVQILRVMITGISLLAGWVVANTTVGDTHGWLWFAVAVGVWPSLSSAARSVAHPATSNS